MEKDSISRTEINSVPSEKVLQTSIDYMDRKRKLQAEELGTPPTKHKWSSQSFAPEYTFPSKAGSDIEYMCVDRGELSGVSTVDESEQESGKGSNSVSVDTDSIISVSNEAEVGADQGYFKQYSSFQPSTSSGDWGGSCSKLAVNSSDCNLVMKSSLHILESPSVGKEHDFPHHDTGLQSSINCEERLLEFRGHVDCSCPECRAFFEVCANKQLEEMIYSNGAVQKNYVLSSGRWTPNQDTQQSTKKLTIDKEFEQYFSMLML